MNDTSQPLYSEKSYLTQQRQTANAVYRGNMMAQNGGNDPGDPDELHPILQAIVIINIICLCCYLFYQECIG